jgi:hypothetical protein
VLFAALVFAILAIASLAVDVGFAVLSQSQMQTAADTAALEGVRLRDFWEYRPLSNRYRRPRVSHLVQQVMDDDLQPTGGIPASPEGIPAVPADGADQLRLGAGPIFHLTGGLGTANASALLEVPDAGSLVGPDAWTDDPRLQENRRNYPSGDMLSGTFNRFASHAEDAAYQRDDFTPAAEVGPDTNEAQRTLGFLVRLRRTRGANTLDEVPGVASRGATIPFLFGMGSTIRAADPEEYNPRTDGLTTRAVAIAVGRPMLSGGPRPLDANGFPVLDRRGLPVRGVGFWHFPAGVGTPAQAIQRRHCAVALTRAFWSTLPVVQLSNPITILPDGGLETGGVLVGRLMVAPCDVAASGTCGITVGTSVGQSVGADLSQPPYSMTQPQIEALLPGTQERIQCFFPIYAPVVNGAVTEQRIIAFGVGEFGAVGDGTFQVVPGWTTDVDMDDCPVVVAPDNASASLPRRNLPELPTSTWNQIFEATNQFVYPNGNLSYAWQNVRPGTALAPALIR